MNLFPQPNNTSFSIDQNTSQIYAIDYFQFDEDAQATRTFQKQKVQGLQNQLSVDKSQKQQANINTKSQQYNMKVKNQWMKIQCINFQEIKQRKRLHQDNIKNMNKSQWNKCVKLDKEMEKIRETKIKQSKHKDKQKKNKQSNSNIDINEMIKRNKVWQQNRNKNIFQQARRQFLRGKQFCYFNPKII